ncbi:hypothetical protein [Paractinoplanes globisporus]|uniref:Histone H3 n=1 Tax=Paractinoplanes globisporus TaxID=113565 RepID=A0ABW6WTH7_9ACTN|nr:hypothetical protein [Actinoplanes globisporus]
MRKRTSRRPTRPAGASAAPLARKGVEPSHVALATRSGAKSRLPPDLSKAVVTHLTSPPR